MRYGISVVTALVLILLAASSRAVEGPDIDKVAAAWHYPEATDIASAGKPSFYSTTFNTPDPTGTVLKYYVKKLEIDPGDLADPDPVIGVKSGSIEGGGAFIIVRSTSATTGGADEVVFTRKSKSALTTIVLHRVQGSKLTRVTINHAELGGD